MNDELTKYKQTKIGIIPNDWEVKPIKNCCEIIGGGTPSTNNSEYWNGNINWFTPTEIKSKFVFESERKITNEGLNNSSAKLLPQGTILLTTRATIGEASIAQTECTTNQGFQSLICKNNTDTRFFYELVKFNKKELYRRANGSTFLEISKDEIKKILLPIPPLPEQKAIANCLTTWDKGIEKLTALITAKKTRKKALMQSIFNDELRIKNWKEVKLGEIAEYRRGSFPQPYGLEKWYDDKNGFPFVQVYDVDKNFKLKSNTKRKISQLATEQSVFIKKGTIIITLQGSIGRVAITQYDAFVDRTLLLFEKFNQPTNKIFFIHILHRLFEREKQKAPGGTIKTITKEVLSNFSITFPPLAEQQEIANLLSTADKEITLLEQKLVALQMQKRGFMQVLLTGKLRIENYEIWTKQI